MSTVYVTEPPTRGKVLLYTTFGEVEVELWAKEAPLACRNFVVLAQEGYYNNTMFHRVIKGFMLQGGDRYLTGGGNGGDCIYEDGMKVDFLSKFFFFLFEIDRLGKQVRENSPKQYRLEMRYSCVGFHFV